MFKQIFVLCVCFLLLFSFVFSTKLVFVPQTTPYESLITSNYDSQNPKGNYEFVNDYEYNDLVRKNPEIKVMADINNSLIQPFQIYSVPSIKADYIWTKGFTGQNLKIGVIDSGISYSSDALTNKISVAVDFADDINEECHTLEHGCLVSSILAGRPSLDPDYNGVAYDANLVSAKIFDSSGSVPVGVNFETVFGWVVANGANYINNSWGSAKYDPNTCIRNPFVNADGNGDNAISWDYLDYSFATAGTDALFMFAAGNSGHCTLNGYSISDDCSGYNILCVGAVNDNDTNNRNDDTYAWFSSQGPTDDDRKKPDLTAPGQDIFSEGYSSWDYWDGTSASTPHVTASAALLSQLGLTPLEVKALLINSADDVNAVSWDRYTGWGYVNLQNAYDQNSFSREYVFDVDNFYYDNNFYNTLIYKSLDDYFFLDSNENAKCSLVWRRSFDNNGNPFLQNFDLNLIKADSNQISNSSIDNVEQVSITTADSNSYLIISCSNTCFDFNYALACNLDYNRIIFDYYIANDNNFYTSDNNGNFKLYFNFGKLTGEPFDSNLDINFDLNLHNSNSFVLFSVVDYNRLIDYNIDLNSDFYPLTDYNLSIDFNYYSNDFNKSFGGLTNSDLSLYNNIVPENDDENIYYLSDFNLTKDFKFYDSYIYFLDYNDFNSNYSRNYAVDNNKITSVLDFNAEDYTFLGRFDLDFNACDIFGNCLNKDITIYVPYFDLEDGYIDYNNNFLYYKEDLNDLNLIFYYNETKDYNIYLIGDNNAQYHFSKDQNIYYYDINLDYNNIILKDNNKDVNVFSLQLVLDKKPVFITTTITEDFNILVQDADLNSDATEVSVDGSPVDVEVVNDGNNYYISGTGSSTVGAHTLDINVYDLANNSATNQYTYTIEETPQGPGGGGGGSSSYEFAVTGDVNGKYYSDTALTITLKEKGKINIVPNADVNIKYPDANVKTEKTNSSGTISFTPLLVGDYIFTYTKSNVKYTKTITIVKKSTQKETEKESIIENLNKLLEIKDFGSVVLDTLQTNTILYFYDANGNSIYNGSAKIYDNNVLLATLPFNKYLVLDKSYSNKKLTIFGYIKDKLVFKQSIFIPELKQTKPDVDINNQQITTFEDKNVLENKNLGTSSARMYYFLFLGVILLFLIFYIIHLKTKKR